MLGHLMDAYLRTMIQQDYLKNDFWMVFWDELMFYMLEKIMPWTILLVLAVVIFYWVRAKGRAAGLWGEAEEAAPAA